MMIYTCACGRECRGQNGLATHARACGTYQQRHREYIAAIESPDSAEQMSVFRHRWPFTHPRKETR